MFYPLIKLILLTVLWKPFSSHPHFPHTFSTQQWVKSAYQGVKYSLYSIRGSEENKFCCDQSCHWCWTMSGKIKKRYNALCQFLKKNVKKNFAQTDLTGARIFPLWFDSFRLTALSVWSKEQFLESSVKKDSWFERYFQTFPACF